MSVKLVIFDIAGTTLEDKNYVGKCINLAMKKHGYQVEEEHIKEVMGIEKPVAIHMLLARMHKEKVKQEEVERIHETYLTMMLDFFENDPQVKEIKGTSELFSQLRGKGIKIGLDTGFDRRTANIIIDRLGWREKVDATVTSDEVENGRPAPDMGLKLMELLEIDDVSQVAKVGDTISDLGEGAALGCKYNIGVTSGAYTKEQLKRLPHTHIIDNIRRLPEIIMI